MNWYFHVGMNPYGKTHIIKNQDNILPNTNHILEKKCYIFTQDRQTIYIIYQQFITIDLHFLTVIIPDGIINI